MYVYVMVTFQASGLMHTHGISVAPSGRFRFVRDRPIGSLVAGIWAFFTSTPDEVVQLRVLDVPGRTFSARKAMYSSGVDCCATDTSMRFTFSRS